MMCEWCADRQDRRHYCLTREVSTGNEPPDEWGEVPEVCDCTVKHYH